MSDFVVRRWDLDPYRGDQAPPHVHYGSDEAFCVLAGRLEVLAGSKRQLLEPGEFLLVPAGTTHTFATVGDDPVQVLAVMTPEIDALIEALHVAESAHEKSAAWSRYNAAVVEVCDED